MKKVVYTKRIRLLEFFRDFDKLRTGFIAPNHFLSGVSMAGIDKFLTPHELQTLGESLDSFQHHALASLLVAPPSLRNSCIN
jgi:hypothetical protein